MSVRMSSAGDHVSPNGPQVVTIQLCKSNSGMGLSIVAAKVCLNFFMIAMVNGPTASMALFNNILTYGHDAMSLPLHLHPITWLSMCVLNS